MRKNEHKTLDEFKAQYIGEWSPSDGHWLGLDFIYDQNEYRLHTGCMFADEGEALFSLYQKTVLNEYGKTKYVLLGQYDSMDALLDSSVISGRKFKEIIMDDNTELVGQD